jgi:serine/threonine protein kinase/formylglycine-generating enzyme required for sulfatase activity
MGMGGTLLSDHAWEVRLLNHMVEILVEITTDTAFTGMMVRVKDARAWVEFPLSVHTANAPAQVTLPMDADVQADGIATFTSVDLASVTAVELEYHGVPIKVGSVTVNLIGARAGLTFRGTDLRLGGAQVHTPLLLEPGRAPASVGGASAASDPGSWSTTTTAAHGGSGPGTFPYRDAGLVLGHGSGGTVTLMHDERHGDRLVAMKRMYPHTNALRQRVKNEVLGLANLEHNGIPKLYDSGDHPDGDVYYTMQYIVGESMEAVARRGRHGVKWAVEVVAALCEIVAYAHANGVIHRDIKPLNIMIRADQDVVLVDWGLVKSISDEDQPRARAAEVVTPGLTQHGAIIGTRQYMSPEQAAGQPATPASDVYALGVVLRDLIRGRAELKGVPPIPPAEPLPSESGDEDTSLRRALHRLHEGAMAHSPKKRPTADALRRACEAWLQHARAAQAVFAALQIEQDRRALTAEILDLRDRATAHLSAVESWAPESDKYDGWRLEDRARELEDKRFLLTDDYVEALQHALRLFPDMPEATALLAEHYRDAHDAAEQANERIATRLLSQVTRYGQRQHAEYLRGDGTLTLVTEPPDAAVTLLRHVNEHRREVEVYVKMLGRTPLHAVPIEMGRYVLHIEAPGCHPVRYPVHIRRLRPWHGHAPGQDRPTVIHLPPIGTLSEHEIYVPAGWFRAGNTNPMVRDSTWRMHWLDGFVVRRFHVTNQEYLAFLNDLARSGDMNGAARYQPRSHTETDSQNAYPLFHFDEALQAFRFDPEAKPHPQLPEHPVTHIDHDSAAAYARWFAAKDQKPWRLISEWEWEKAARGVDGRLYPWGDHFDPSRARTLQSQPGTPSPVPVGAYPLDESVYGVRDLSGNVAEWCAEREQTQGADIAPYRGGSYNGPAATARTSGRGMIQVYWRESVLGFRLARDAPSWGESSNITWSANSTHGTLTP